MGGYIENLNSEISSDGRGKRGYITARIPADKLDGFITEVSEQERLLPFLFVWVVFILLLILIVRFFLKLSDKKKAKKQEKNQMVYQGAVKRMNAVNMTQNQVNMAQNPVQNSVKEEENK